MSFTAFSSASLVHCTPWVFPMRSCGELGTIYNHLHMHSTPTANVSISIKWRLSVTALGTGYSSLTSQPHFSGGELGGKYFSSQLSHWLSCESNDTAICNLLTGKISNQRYLTACSGSRTTWSIWSGLYIPRSLSYRCQSYFY